MSVWLTIPGVVKFVCWIVGHKLGDIVERYRDGDHETHIPTSEEVVAASEKGASQILMRIKMKCLRCGRVVNA